MSAFRSDTKSEYTPSFGTSNATLTGSTTHRFPAQFYIGNKRVAPFIDIPEIKTHLALLHAFTLLRDAVEKSGLNEHGVSELFYSTASPAEGHPGGLNKYMPKTKEARWTWFVGLAVERSVLLVSKLPSYL